MTGRRGKALPRPDIIEDHHSRPMLAALLLLAGVLSLWIVSGAQPSEHRQALGHLLYLPVCVLSAALLLRAAGRTPQPQRRAWFFLGAAVTCWSLGEATYGLLDAWLGLPAFPSLADLFYLSFVPLVMLGLFHFPRLPLTRPQLAGYLLDMTIAVAVIANIIWHTTDLPATLRANAAEPLAQLLSLAYPLSDLLLGAALLVTALWRPQGLSRLQLLLLSAGMVSFLGADLAYGYQESKGLYSEWGATDLFWLWGLVLFGMAGYLATPPSRARLPGRLMGLSSERSRSLRELLPHTALIASFGIFLLLHANEPDDHGLELGLTVVTLLVLARQIVAVLERQSLSADLFRREQHDDLTGLPSRSALHTHLTGAIRGAERGRHLVAVMYIDLDRMKYVNDWYGYAQGDLVLQTIAGRFGQLVRQGDLVARFSGDEFVVVLRQLTDEQDAKQIAERFLQSVAQPLTINDDQLYLTASIGISLCPQDAGDAELALHNAYLAIEQAKQQGKNTVRFYEENLTQSLVHRGQLESHLRHALQNDGLSVHYQPLQQLRSGTIAGFEALVRWTSPTLGVVSPASIIPLAEERGLIVPLGDWVMQRSLYQVKRWRESMHDQIYVSVNVSALQFKQPGFVHKVHSLLEEVELPGAALMLELTESSLVEDIEGSTQIIEALRQLGVRVALDDFGTGYSSLSYLRQLPVDVLKIDRSFVQSIDDGGKAFVRAITTLAHDLRLTVVVEGIEEREQLVILAELGCDLGQGFLIGRPARAAEVEHRYDLPVEVLFGE